MDIVLTPEQFDLIRSQALNKITTPENEYYPLWIKCISGYCFEIVDYDNIPQDLKDVLIEETIAKKKALYELINKPSKDL